MTRLATCLLATALLTACGPLAPMGRGRISPYAGGASAAPVAPASTPAAAGTPATAAGTAFLLGRATGASGPLAKAAVTIYDARSDAPLAAATANAQGAFGLDLPAGVPAGTLLRVVAKAGDRALSGLVAAGAGNLIGQDAASLIGQDAGSLVGQDAASLVGQDAASLIGQDAGSYRLQAVVDGRALLTPATTLAALALGKRLRSALQSAGSAESRREVLAAVDDLASRADSALAAAGADAGAAIEKAAGEAGDAGLPAALASRLVRADAGLAASLRTSAQALGAVITAAGGKPEAVSFGGVTVAERTSSSGGGGSQPAAPGTASVVISFGAVYGTTATAAAPLVAASGLAGGWSADAGVDATVTAGATVVLQPRAGTGDVAVTFVAPADAPVPSRYAGLGLDADAADMPGAFTVTLMTRDGREIGQAGFTAPAASFPWAAFGISRAAAAGVRRVRFSYAGGVSVGSAFTIRGLALEPTLVP